MNFEKLQFIQHDGTATDFRSIGLWIAPALLPYPMSAIAELCRNGQRDDARRLITTQFHLGKLRDIVSSWVAVPAFIERSQLFDDALFSHEHLKFTQSVSTLIPHIEGVITDWAYKSSSTVPRNQSKKFQHFRDVLQLGAIKAFSDRRIDGSPRASLISL